MNGGFLTSHFTDANYNYCRLMMSKLHHWLGMVMEFRSPGCTLGTSVAI